VSKNIFSCVLVVNKNMEKFLEIDKIFKEKILNHDQNIFFNHSTKLLINIINNNIKEIIWEYHFVNSFELKSLVNNLIINLLKLKNKNYYSVELLNICDELIQMIEEINYPLDINIFPSNLDNFSSNIDNNLFYNNKNKNSLKKSVKFYHKPSSHLYYNLESDSDSDSENIYWNFQKNFIKNNLSSSLIDNNMLNSIGKIKKNILGKYILSDNKANIYLTKKSDLNDKTNMVVVNIKENKTGITDLNDKNYNDNYYKKLEKKNFKEYKIVSRNFSFDWEKSYISI
jgi:hypothetical protein